MRAAGLLSLGKGGQAIFMVVALALSARTLGLEQFGVLMLIHSFIMAIAKAVRFQTWQALVHYGAKAQDASDTPRLQRIIQFTGFVDILTAFLAFGVVWIGSGPAVDLFGLDPALVGTTQLYGSVIVVMVLNGTPSGILQLFDRFDRIAWQTIIAPCIRFIGSIYLFLTQGSLLEFLMVWYAAEFFAAFILIVMGVINLREEHLLSGLLRPSKRALKPESGIWRYVGGTQLASTLDLSGTHLPILFVGGILGPGAAGLYRVAKEFAGVLLKPSTKIFGQAIYPDLARLSAQNDFKARRNMIGRTALLIGGIALSVFALFVFFGRQAIALSAGPDFTGAYATMIWLCAGGVINAASFALEPLLISTGLLRQTVAARLLSTLIFLPLLYVFLHQYGVVGAGVAGFIYAALMNLFMLIAGRNLLRIQANPTVLSDKR